VGATSSTIWLAGTLSMRSRSRGAFSHPDAAIGSVVSIDDSREKDWKLPIPEKVEERDRGAHRLLDVAAAEDLWIGAALTKSTIRSAGDLPKPVLWPNCCLR
jgi:hypothetical protein